MQTVVLFVTGALLWVLGVFLSIHLFTVRFPMQGRNVPTFFLFTFSALIWFAMVTLQIFILDMISHFLFNTEYFTTVESLKIPCGVFAGFGVFVSVYVFHKRNAR